MTTLFKNIPSLFREDRVVYDGSADGPSDRPAAFSVREPAMRTAIPAIKCTTRFISEAQGVFGDVAFGDLERGAMAFAIEGTPIYYSCRPYPDGIERRGQTTLEAMQGSSAVEEVFRTELERTGGKCCVAPTHVHPMDFPTLSGIDIATYERLRSTPDDPSPLGFRRPYPVVLFNIRAAGNCDILGFWVDGGCSTPAPIEIVDDHSPEVETAWRLAKPLAFFSREAKEVRMVSSVVPPHWSVRLAENPASGRRVAKAERTDGARCLVPLSDDAPFGVGIDDFARYVDWPGLFADHALRGTQDPRLVEYPALTRRTRLERTAADLESGSERTLRPTIRMSRRIAEALHRAPRGTLLFGTYDPKTSSGVVSSLRQPGEEALLSRFPVAEVGWSPLSNVPFHVDSDGTFFERDGSAPVSVEVFDEGDFFKRTPFDRNVMDYLAKERVLLVGTGSVGGTMALELAKSGVGSLALADPDALEIHNGMRHVLGAGQVGLAKTAALKAYIEEHAPCCRCESHPVDLFANGGLALRKTIEEFRPTRILASTDNFSVQIKAQMAAIRFGIPFMAVSCGSNAVEGEAFFWEPGQASGWREGLARRGCYVCAHEGSRTPTRSRHFDYSTDAPGSYGGEPALGTFIARIDMQAAVLMTGWLLLKCPVATKLADSIRHEYEDLGLQYVRMGGPYLQPEEGCLTAGAPWGMEWYRVSKRDKCPCCGEGVDLDPLLFRDGHEPEASGEPVDPYDKSGMEKVT